MRTLFLIALGSALGGVARNGLSAWVAQRAGDGFPWGTLAVNVLGSLVVGALAAVGDSARWGLSVEARQFLMIGVLGGFTTFSAFSLQTLRLIQDGDWARAAGNVLLSVGLGLVAAAAGYRLARGLAG
ncbi:MAG: fluoride efflux transporter FluC [Opitutaceae bacterium]